MNPLTIPSLAPDEIHVWTCDLAPDAHAYAPLLSEDEHARAKRYRFEIHRNRFIAARGTARRILGAYVERDPASLRFTYEAHGRPRLDGVSFNISHCEDRMLLAVRKSGDVGVDVERLRVVAEADSIASTYFDAEVAERIRLLSEPERSRLFLRYWTRLEAEGKFLGRGVVGRNDFNTQLTLVDLNPPDEHVAAVAVESGPGGPTCLDFRL